jgi:hypothetical protein
MVYSNKFVSNDVASTRDIQERCPLLKFRELPIRMNHITGFVHVYEQT